MTLPLTEGITLTGEFPKGRASISLSLRERWRAERDGEGVNMPLAYGIPLCHSFVNSTMTSPLQGRRADEVEKLRFLLKKLINFIG